MPNHISIIRIYVTVTYIFVNSTLFCALPVIPYTPVWYSGYHPTICLCIGHVPATSDAEDGDTADVLWPEQAAGDRRLVQWHQPPDHEEAAQHRLCHRWVTHTHPRWLTRPHTHMDTPTHTCTPTCTHAQTIHTRGLHRYTRTWDLNLSDPHFWCGPLDPGSDHTRWPWTLDLLKICEISTRFKMIFEEENILMKIYPL